MYVETVAVCTQKAARTLREERLSPSKLPILAAYSHARNPAPQAGKLVFFRYRQRQGAIYGIGYTHRFLVRAGSWLAPRRPSKPDNVHFPFNLLICIFHLARVAFICL